MTIHYHEAPDYSGRRDGLTGPAQPGRSVFMAGGITGCPPWHAESVELFEQVVKIADPLPHDLHLLNPARKNFPIHDPDAGRQQVIWEQLHLLDPDAVTMFWFPDSGPVPQPIALLEFGQLLGMRAVARAAGVTTMRPFVIGADPNYVRRNDLQLFLDMHEPAAVLHSSLLFTVTHAVRVVKDLQADW
jgi:hypothetical protein